MLKSFDEIVTEVRNNNKSVAFIENLAVIASKNKDINEHYLLHSCILSPSELYVAALTLGIEIGKAMEHDELTSLMTKGN